MNRTIRSILILLATTISISGLLINYAFAEKSIGLVLWDDDKNYTDAKNSFLEQLGKDGFGEPNIKFSFEAAGGNKAKAAQIAAKFAAAKPDMIVSFGTSATVAIAREIKDIPVVFALVYDPVDSKIADDWKSSGNNTTGTSSKVPMSLLVEKLKQVAPVKNLAVLYTPGERNSEAQLKDLQVAAGGLGIKVVPVPITNREEVQMIMSVVVGKVEAVYLSGSSLVSETLPVIVDIATKAKVVTVTHQGDKADKGVLLAISANNYDLGRLAAEKVVKILKGAKPSSIPIEMAKKFDVILNMKTAKAGGIGVPQAFVKAATRVIE